jgi:bifunctional non-homologous end joining protein LigD
MKTDKPAIAKKGKTLIFVRPELIAGIEFRGWTDDVKQRHSSFKGFRDESDASGIYKLDDHA